MTFVDTHCHLHDAVFTDPRDELARARDAGVSRVVVVGTSPDDWSRARAFAEAHPEAYLIAGWHPNMTAEYDDATLPDLEDVLAHHKCLALGEIGLDRHHHFAPWDRQIAACRDGLEMAARLGRNVVFHARDAVPDVLDLLEAMGDAAPRHVLWHCYNGTTEDADRATRLPVTTSLYGVDGPVTYPKAHDLRATLRHIGLEKLVLETDAPYLAPAPHRGKTNRPAYIPLIAQGLADALQTPLAEVARVTTANAIRFFGDPIA